MKIIADEIFSLTLAVKDSSGKGAAPYKPITSQKIPVTEGPVTKASKTTKEEPKSHPDQPSNNEPWGDKSVPSPSQPILIPSKRCPPPPGELTKEHILQQ